MDKLKKNIEKAIKNIEPKAKIIFTIQNMFWWGLYAIFTLAWAKAFWILCFMISDRGIWHNPGELPAGFVLKAFPFFWLISFLLFMSLAFIYTQNTKSAYKFSYSSIILSSLFLSAILWSLFHMTWLSDIEDNFIRWKMPLYGRINPRCEEMWAKDNRDKLEWVIENIQDTYAIIRDTEWNKWHVDTTNTFKVPRQGSQIRAVWQSTWDWNFKAEMIAPPCHGKRKIRLPQN